MDTTVLRVIANRAMGYVAEDLDEDGVLFGRDGRFEATVEREAAIGRWGERRWGAAWHRPWEHPHETALLAPLPEGGAVSFEAWGDDDEFLATPGDDVEEDLTCPHCGDTRAYVFRWPKEGEDVPAVVCVGYDCDESFGIDVGGFEP